MLLRRCFWCDSAHAADHLRGVPELSSERKVLEPLQDKSEEINKRILAAKAAKDDAALAKAREEWAANRKLIAPALAPFEVVKDRMQFWQEAGGLLGRIALAVLAVVVISRRTLLRIFVVPGLILMPLTFGYWPSRANRCCDTAWPCVRS